MESSVIIKQEPIAPSSPTQTIPINRRGQNEGSPEPPERNTIRLAPLKRLTHRDSGESSGSEPRVNSNHNSLEGRRGSLSETDPSATMVESSSSSSMAIVIPSSSSQPSCQWKNWRNQCHSRGIRDKLRFALENANFYKDVTFIVGKDAERISAHKLILRLGSPVFENIMEGLNNESSESGDVLEIPEVEPFPFKQLLHFMYTDEFNTENLKCSDIMVILQAARRFQVQDLSSLCVQALKNHINDETAISLLSLSELGKDVEDLELRDLVLAYICRNPKKIFYSSNFMDLSYQNLVLLIENDDLEWDEISIFKSCIRWADGFCRGRGLEPIANNLRGALGEIIYRIRFPLMSAEQFTFDVIPIKVLTSEEQVQVFKYLCLPENLAREQLQLETTSFNCKRRSYMLGGKGQEFCEDSFHSKNKSESPHCLPSLASNNCDFTEAESEDTGSQVSSCFSSVLSASTPSTQKQKRQRSPSPSNSPTLSKKHSSLFGDIHPPPKRSKDRPITKRKSIDLDNTTIEIENVEIELSHFIEECNSNPQRKEIESIKLSKVTITDNDKIQQFHGMGKKVRFPKLREFHMHIIIPSLTKCKDFIGEINLKNYLFFIIKVGKQWSTSEILSLGINISFSINGITLIKIDHGGRKSLILNKIKACPKILENLVSTDSYESSNGLTNLVISHPTIPLTSESYPTQSLERLILLRVEKIPEFSLFIKKFKRLKELCVLSLDNQIIDLSRDLSSRDRLRKLTLGSSFLKFSVATAISSGITDLFLFKCDWEAGFEDNFTSLFPNLKRAYFFLGHKLTSKLLSKLFQIKTTTEIACSCFDWDTTTQTKEISATLEILNSTGLTEANDKSFTLIKEGDNLKGWKGRKSSFLEVQEEIYKNFQFYHLYSSYALFANSS